MAHYGNLEAMEANRPEKLSLKRRLNGLMLEGFFTGMSKLGKLHRASNPAQHGIEVLKNIPYVDDGQGAHLLDVWRPIERSGPCPVLIYVHGGAFSILSKETHWLMALLFARQGFVVFNINYRLAPRHPFPAAIEDACNAATWVTKHAADYGGDRHRMVFSGESAGGNLALSMMIACCYERPEPWATDLYEANPGLIAVLPACGLLEAGNLKRFKESGKVSPFVLDRMATAELNYLPPTLPAGLDTTLANPLVFLEKGIPPQRPLVPNCATVGTKDPLLYDTRRLKAALDAMNVPCEAHYYEGGLHGFHAFLFDPRARACWDDQYRFLHKYVDGLKRSDTG